MKKIKEKSHLNSTGFILQWILLCGAGTLPMTSWAEPNSRSTNVPELSEAKSKLPSVLREFYRKSHNQEFARAWDDVAATLFVERPFDGIRPGELPRLAKSLALVYAYALKERYRLLDGETISYKDFDAIGDALEKLVSPIMQERTGFLSSLNISAKKRIKKFKQYFAQELSLMAEVPTAKFDLWLSANTLLWDLPKLSYSGIDGYENGMNTLGSIYVVANDYKMWLQGLSTRYENIEPKFSMQLSQLHWAFASFDNGSRTIAGTLTHIIAGLREVHSAARRQRIDIQSLRRVLPLFKSFPTISAPDTFGNRTQLKRDKNVAFDFIQRYVELDNLEFWARNREALIDSGFVEAVRALREQSVRFHLVQNQTHVSVDPALGAGSGDDVHVELRALIPGGEILVLDSRELYSGDNLRIHGRETQLQAALRQMLEKLPTLTPGLMQKASSYQRCEQIVAKL